MTEEDVLKLRLNYFELAFIQCIPVKKSIEIFEKCSGRSTVEDWTTCKVDRLLLFFDSVKSLDNRYDGINELVFNLMCKSHLYKNLLNDMDFIITGRFSGGQTVLKKIMDKEQLIHLYSVRKTKYNEIMNNDLKLFK